jgi:disulfide bond formation protein DsbB
MPPNKRKKQVVAAISIALILVICLLGIQQVYRTIDVRDHSLIDSKAEFVGDIETTPKKWLNGHFGLFFRFKHLGNLNWLLPLLLIIFIIKQRKNGKKLERWQKALMFVWFVTTVFLGLKGYGNARYQLTLFPVTVTMILLLMWKLLENQKRFIKFIVFSLVAITSIFNVVHYGEHFRNTWERRVELKTQTFPKKLIDYINSNPKINNNSRVFVINQPIFFYQTRKWGLDYFAPDAVGIWRELRRNIGNSEKVYKILKKRLDVNYILLKSIRKHFYRGRQLEEFLETQCVRVMEDNGWLLFRLRRTSLSGLIKSKRVKTLKVWKHGKKTKKATDNTSEINEFQEVSPQLVRFYREGIFKFEIKKGKRNDIHSDNRNDFISVRNTRVKPGRKARLQFGYEFGKNGLDEKIPEGKWVTFIVKTSISPKLLNLNNAIFVMDYKKNKNYKKGSPKNVPRGDWQQSKTVFTSPRWRTYLVSKRIRKGVSRLILMFRFTPLSPEHRLRISDVKIVISDKQLK